VFDTAVLALQPRKGVPLTSFGSARRSASFLGGVTNANQTKENTMNINKIIFTGRLTKDPELRAISEDMKVCQLRLAVDGMGRGREVGFINVSVFGKAGEAAAEYLGKGWLVAVDGRLEYGEWESDGAKRHAYTVVGNVEFLTAPKPAEEPAKPARNGRKAVAA
jgi:single-strand DNA-binding protein